jgi:hypothetical protein
VADRLRVRGDLSQRGDERPAPAHRPYSATARITGRS